MAWAEKLPTGRYRGCYRDAQQKKRYVLGEDGKGYTQEAQAKREAAITEVEARNPRARHPDGGKITCGDWIDLWWPTRKVAGSTAKADRSKLETHIRPRWGDVPIEDVFRTDMQAWVDKLDRTELSASTIHKVFRIMSGAMKAATLTEPRRLDTSPCVSIKLPVIGPADERFLDREEFADLVEMMPDPQTVMICRLLVGTGMRWGEMAALHRRHVDLKAQRVDIVAAYDAEEDAIRYPKGKKKRAVPITGELAEQLREWMRDRPTAVKCGTRHLKGSNCSSDLVIPGPKGEVIDYYQFEKYVWRVALPLAQLGRVTIHDLRHTYASWLIQSGVPIDVVQELLGHEDLKTTQRYAHRGKTHWDHVRAVLSGVDLDEKRRQAWAWEVLDRMAKAAPADLAAVYEELTGAAFEQFAPYLPLALPSTSDSKVIALRETARSGS